MKPRAQSQGSLFVGGRRAALFALGAVFVAACGGGSDNPFRLPDSPASPQEQVPPPVSPPPVATPEEAVLRLYESVAVHEALGASPFVFTLYSDDTIWTDWPCYQLSLNGQAPSPGTVLPT